MQRETTQAKELAIVDMDTAEIIGTMPQGSSIVTPDEKKRRYEAMQKRKQNEAKSVYNRITKADSNKLTYSFVNSASRITGVSMPTVARLIYLSTFTGFQKGGKLMITERTAMLKKDLPKVLNVSQSVAYSFCSEAIKGGYITEKNNCLYLDNNVFKRGKLSREQYTQYQILYDRCVRNLYQQTATSKHKHLGYIFSMLPFINVEYNILCYDTFETDLDRIQPLTVSDFARLIDYDVSKVARLIKAYSKITFDVNGRQERFASFVDYKGNTGDLKICINPHIFYCGNSPEKVEILGMFGK